MKWLGLAIGSIDLDIEISIFDFSRFGARKRVTDDVIVTVMMMTTTCRDIKLGNVSTRWL